jgi:hypothetical protein
MLGGLLRRGTRARAVVVDYWRAADDAQRRLWTRTTALVTALAFWVAIPLPFLYIPVLVRGVDGRAEVVALLLLIALHVVTLGLGRPYATRRFSEDQ